MCGIIGALGKNLNFDFDDAVNRLSHRGPDDIGFYKNEDNNIQLGHTRLAIIDLSKSASQPMIDKINQNNPYEISRFEKEIKSLSYSIQDETLRKYVLEDFLEKIKKLTPIQTSRREYKYIPYKNKKEYQILKETKLLHQKRKD